MIVISINTAARLIKIDTRFATFNEWKEENHPRDGEGKFAQKISLKGDELGSYNDIKELRNNAKMYYKEYYQGKVIQRKELGNINFSRKGLNETLSNGAQETKIKLIPAIKDVIVNGKIGEEIPLKHPRKDDIVSFIPIVDIVVMEGKQYQVGVLLGKDRKGHLYYDMFVHS